MKPIRMMVLLAASIVVAYHAGGQPLPVPGGETPRNTKSRKSKTAMGDWEVLFTDDSRMKVSLLDEQLLLQTPHGSLTIPTRDIRKIEVGVRLSTAERQQFDAAIVAIGTKDAKSREEGKAQLKALGHKIAPFLKRAIRKCDGDARPHLEQAYEAVAGDRDQRKQEPSDYDAISTDDSVFAGRLDAAQLRIGTYQFGELNLRVTDAKTLQFGRVPGVDAKLEMADGANIYQLCQTHLGKVVGITVTGSVQGAVWGSGPYTADSTMGTAAVHAGAVKNGETKVIRVRLVQDPGFYQGTIANGIATSNFGQFPSGAYEILAK